MNCFHAMFLLYQCIVIFVSDFNGYAVLVHYVLKFFFVKCQQQIVLMLFQI